MEPGELAALVLSVSAAIAVVGLLFTFASIIRAMTVFRKSVTEITSHTLPLIADTHTAVKRANAGLVKVDGILDTAESISNTVDSASRLAYTAFSGPVVKLLALATGTARAVGRFRARHHSLAARRPNEELAPQPALPPGKRAARAQASAQRAARAQASAQGAARAQASAQGAARAQASAQGAARAQASAQGAARARGR